MIHRLLQRLCMPLVASVLSKEQLCVSLAAVAQLEPFSLFSRNELYASDCNILQFSDEFSSILVAQTAKLTEKCTFMELGMIARGAASLRWRSASFIEKLSKQLYEFHEVSHASRGRLRLADFTHVLSAAIGAEQYFNVTLYTLLLQHTNSLLCGNEHFDALFRFAIMAYIYLGGHRDHMQLILSSLEGVCCKRRWRELLRSYENAVQTVAVSWVDRRQTLLSQLKSCRKTVPDGAVYQWDASRARMYVYLFVIDQLLPCSMAFDTKVRLCEVIECLELFVFFKLEDPAAQIKLEDAVLQALHQIAQIHSDDLHKLRHIVYGSPHRFPRLMAMLRSQAASSNSLQEVTGVLCAYMDAIKGKRVSDELLHCLIENLDVTQPDHIAFATCVFARQGRVPHHFSLLAASTPGKLSLKGVSAMLRAAKWDECGTLLLSAEMAVRQIDLLDLQSAPLSVVEELADAAALPMPRHVNVPHTLCEGEAFLKLRLLDIFGTIFESSSVVLLRALEAALHTVSFDKNARLAHRVLDRAAKSDKLSRSEWVAVLKLMTHVHDVRCIVLMDKLTEVFKTALEECRGASMKNDNKAGEIVLDIAAFQAIFGAPELESALNHLLHSTDDELHSFNTECLIAMGLLANRTKRFGIVATVQAILLSRFASSPVFSAPVVSHAVTFLTQAMEPSAALIEALVGFLATSVNLNDDNATGCSIPMIDPTQMAHLLALYCRVSYNGSQAGQRRVARLFPQSLLQYVRDHLLGLDVGAFVDLCRSLHGGHLSEGFADSVIESLPRIVDRLDPDQIADCVWGLGHLERAGQRLSHQVATEKISDYVVDNADLFWSGPVIARMLDGFASLHCTKRSLYSVFAGKLALRGVRATLDRESVSGVLHAFGMVKYLDKALIDRLSHVYAQNACTLSASNILNSIRAHSRLMLLNSDFYEQMGQQIAARSTEFPLFEKCEVLKAYGHVEQEHTVMAQVLLHGIVEDMHKLSDVNEAVDAFGALWLMRYNVVADPNSKALVSFVVEHASQLNGNSILKLCSVLKGLNWRHTALLDAIGNQCVQLASQQQLTASAGRAALDALGFFHFHHPLARREVAQLARSVSKEAMPLSEEEEEQLKLLLSH